MNTCPYCELPAKRVLCGSPECRRRYCIEKAMAHKRRSQDALRAVPRICPGCSSEFPREGKRLWCSAACKKRAENRRLRGSVPLARYTAERIALNAARGTASNWVWVSGTCHECGQAFTRHGAASPYCSRRCSSRDKARRRRALTGTRMGPVSRHRIHERDEWTCHICGDPVNRYATVPDLDAPTLDHVVPLAAGGSHTEDNLKTAHFYCNSVKRDLNLSDVA